MSKDSKKRFGERLRESRVALNMSQGDLAKRLGITAQAISSWERAETMPEVEKWADLVNCLGCSLNWLITGVDDAPNARTKDIVLEAVEFALQVDGRDLSASQRHDVLDKAWRAVDSKFGLSRPAPPLPHTKK